METSWKMIFSQSGTKTLVENGLRYIKEEGLKPFLSRILRIAFSPLFRYRKEVFYIRNLSDSVMVKMPELQLVFDEASLADVEDLQKIMYLGNQQIKKWLLNGKRCFVTKAAGKIIHYSWVSFEEGYVDVIDKTIKLRNNMVYIHNCRTLTAYRGLGIFPFVLNKISEYLRSEGIRTAIICAGADNYPSIRSFEKGGFKRVGEVTYLKVLWWFRYKYYGTLPWLNF